MYLIKTTQCEVRASGLGHIFDYSKVNAKLSSLLKDYDAQGEMALQRAN